MTSLSNLIKRHQHEGLKIEAFRAQEIKVDTEFNSSSHKHVRRGGTQDRISEIEREAYEKGFNQGQKDGLALGKKRLEETAKRLDALISSLSELKGNLYREAEEEILKLSVEIARKILDKEIGLDKDMVLRSIRKATEFLTERTAIRILVNPADMHKVEEALPEIKARKKVERIELAEDPSIARGGCILETGFGSINAAIEDQLEAIARELEDELGNTGHGSTNIA